ncbi:MAG: hypothetical protein ANABAC_2736 [Anaerolineae bacterium]|nr:MAG: hypothetical protein ANABAC_2736 [Anaerolineae bacterium]
MDTRTPPLAKNGGYGIQSYYYYNSKQAFYAGFQMIQGKIVIFQLSGFSKFHTIFV